MRRDTTSDLVGMNVLADFLNYDLKKAHPGKEEGTLPLWLCFDLQSAEGIEHAFSVQQSLRDDLLPVISGEPKELPEAYETICRLVSKLSEMNKRDVWSINPPQELSRPGVVGGAYSKYTTKKNQLASLLYAANLLPLDLKLGSIDTDQQYENLVKLFKAAVGKPMPLQNILSRDGSQLETWGLYSDTAAKYLFKPVKLNLLRLDWVLGMELPELTLDAMGAERILYSIALRALQQGDLSRLKVCGVCLSLFVARNLNQSYCLRGKCRTL